MDKKYFETRKGSLEDKINTIAAEQPSISKPETDVKLSVEKKYFETKKGSLEDLASKLVESKLDPVNKDAVKKKFDDRKDKDIDNDGDVDSSDKYLHKRRKAISKAVKKEESVADIIQNKNYSMREALAKVWEASAQKNPFEMFGANTPTSNQGAATVKRDQAAAAKARASGDKSNPGSFGKKKPISSQKKTDTGKPVTKVEINPKV